MALSNIERFTIPYAEFVLETFLFGNTIRCMGNAPYINCMGMKFMPVPGTDVLFSAWETRLADFRSFVRKTGYKRLQRFFQHDHPWDNTGFPQSDDHPVVRVTKKDAQAFCKWLSQIEEKTYRLPTDNEWSIAAGLPPEDGGTPAGRMRWMRNTKPEPIYPWGTQWPPPQGAGNYHPSLEIDDYKFTSPVGSFAANQYGLYDIGGNVWEFCESYWDFKSWRKNFLQLCLGFGNIKGGTLRGGSWTSSQGGIGGDQLDSRYRINPPSLEHDMLFRDVGFRCVIEIS